MKIELNTNELQYIVLALILNDSSVLKNHQAEVVTLIDKVSSLNRMCNAYNDFTISFTVDENDEA